MSRQSDRRQAPHGEPRAGRAQFLADREAIRRARKAKGLSQEALAGAIRALPEDQLSQEGIAARRRMSVRTIWRVERGLPTTPGTVSLIAQVLGEEDPAVFAAA